VTHLALVGLVVAVGWRRAFLKKELDAGQPGALQALGVALLVAVLLVLRFGLLFRQPQGRFLFTMMVPLAPTSDWPAHALAAEAGARATCTSSLPGHLPARLHRLLSGASQRPLNERS